MSVEPLEQTTATEVIEGEVVDVWPDLPGQDDGGEPASAGPDGGGGFVPDLDWAGTLRVRVGWREALDTLRPLPLVPVVPGVAWVATGDPRVLLVSGLATAALVMRYDRRRTAAHRWSTTRSAARGLVRADT